MAKYDREMEARVWQRVQGDRPAEQSEGKLQGLILGAWVASSNYRMLSRLMGGRWAEVLLRLAREKQSHAACIQGMHMLTTGQKYVLRMPQPVQEPVEVLLRKCYGSALQIAAEYEGRTVDAQFGHAFARMAQQEREHCAHILEMLGSLHK